MIGFLLVDKAKGEASFDGVRYLRRILHERRIGFAGTLDPVATGLMIYAVGEATKLLNYLEKSDKVYEVLIHLGSQSNTYDIEGEISFYPNAVEPLRSSIEKILEERFTGVIEQVPPAFSAIKIKGKPAYEYARKGIDVSLKSRKVTIFQIELLTYSYPYLRLRVHCSSGTYIRSLAHDLGKYLECGGYVEELRRIKIGHYSVKNALQLSSFQPITAAAQLLRPEELFTDLIQIELSENEFLILRNGGVVHKSLDVSRGPLLALYSGNALAY